MFNVTDTSFTPATQNRRLIANANLILARPNTTYINGWGEKAGAGEAAMFVDGNVTVQLLANSTALQYGLNATHHNHGRWWSVSSPARGAMYFESSAVVVDGDTGKCWNMDEFWEFVSQ